MLELVALGSDPAAARSVAQERGAVAYLADAPDPDRPFASMVRLATADLTALDAAADVGLYLCFSRTMRSHPGQWRAPVPVPGVVALFGLVGRSDLSHAQVDAYWRDNHAPLALYRHVGMWSYTQCSVVHRFSGPELDGIALCGFGSEADLRQRFFDSPEGADAIRADVAQMADTERSLRRVLTTEWRFG